VRGPLAAPEESPWRQKLHTIIFESDTPAGQAFDIALIVAIITSVAAVIAESIPSVNANWGRELFALEIGFTALFTVEYILRLISVRRPLHYATSAFGIIDFLAFAPTWAMVIFPPAQLFLTIRLLRLLRIFRVLKLTEYLFEAGIIAEALRASRRKIFVFLFTVLTLVVIIGALIHVIEGPENGFTDIPTSMYWTVVTLTTVGYGDISPSTPLGRILAAAVMIMGYSIIAVPTGIVTSEFTALRYRGPSRQTCPSCGRDGHDEDARHCKHCGTAL
jgi:voltage-gated potassium channel